MSIHDENEQQSNGSAQNNQQSTGNANANQSGYGTQQGAAAQNANPYARQGMGNLNSMFRRSGNVDLTESRSAEALQALNKASEDAIASQILTNDHELFRFDRESNHVGLPSILVVKTARHQGEAIAVVRTLILNTDAVRLRPRLVQLGNERIEVPVLPQHVFNDNYFGKIQEHLRKSRGVRDLKVLDAGPLVIPTDFSFKEEMRAIHLLVSSVNRCDDLVARLTGERPFNITEVKEDKEVFTARLEDSGLPAYDLLGNPNRNDLAITMGRTNKGAPQNNDDFYDADTTINHLSAFVNLEWAPAPQQQNTWGQQQPATQIFMPTVVITQVRQAEWITANTPELYLLALANAFRLTAGTAWARAFLPKLGRKKDPSDIGGIGFLTPAGKRINTKGDSFSDADFATLMHTFVREKPAFLIDINPVGENAAIENMLLDAAGSGALKARAVEALFKAGMNLTNGVLAKYFDPNTAPIAMATNVQVHMGYYFDSNNEKRDIRDLGTLEMLNATDGDLNTFNSWYQTMVDTTSNRDMVLKNREGFLRQYLGTSLTITGIADRVLLHPAFIEGLHKALEECGVAVAFENMTSVFNGQRFVGNEFIGQYGVGSVAAAHYGNAQTTTGYGVLGGNQSGRSY